MIAVLWRAFDHDLSELIFRLLFSSIFILLGGEHLLSDELIQELMPAWLPTKRFLSLCAGVLLLSCGFSIAIGLGLRWAATALSLFLVLVTAIVHTPGMLVAPAQVPEQWSWLWTLFQRTNFVKNVCLLGVCFHFFHHEPGRYSVEQWLQNRRARSSMPGSGDSSPSA